MVQKISKQENGYSLGVYWDLFKKENSKISNENNLVTVFQFTLIYIFFRKIYLCFEKNRKIELIIETEKEIINIFIKYFCSHSFKVNTTKNNLSIIFSNSLKSNELNYVISEDFLQRLWVGLSKQENLPLDEFITEIYSVSSKLNQNFKFNNKEKGKYYTPLQITKTMSEEALSLLNKKYNKTQISILDTSCGIGNFLISCFDALSSNLQKSNLSETNIEHNILNIVRKQLFGFDSDVIAIMICKLRLFAKVIDLNFPADRKWDVLNNLQSNIVNKDFLLETNTIKPILLIGNPPWGSIKSTDYKNKIKKNFNLQGGQIDYYRLFLESAMKLDPEIICLITPDSWLEIPGAEKLRREFFNTRKFKKLFILPTNVFSISAHFIGFIADKKTSSQNYEHVITCIRIDESLEEAERFEQRIPIDQNSNFALRTSRNIENRLLEINNILQSSKESIKLGSIIEVSIGYQLYHKTIHKPEEISKKIFHSKTRIGDNWIREITSKDLTKFKILFKTTSYVNKSAEFFRIPPKRFLESKKLLLREVISKDGFVIAKVNDEVFFPKTILSIIFKEQNTDGKLLALLGYLISYICQFDYLINGIKAQRKFFPRISLQSLKNLNFTEKVFSRDIELLVQSLIEFSDSEVNEEEYIDSFVQLQAKIFMIWNISSYNAMLIMNYLQISAKIQEQILSLLHTTY